MLKLPDHKIFNFQFKTEPAWNDEDTLVFLSENGLFLWKDLYFMWYCCELDMKPVKLLAIR